jgi:hypothetical protein
MGGARVHGLEDGAGVAGDQRRGEEEKEKGTHIGRG